MKANLGELETLSRLAKFPAYVSESRTVIELIPGSFINFLTKFEPINPAPPVTRILIYIPDSSVEV
jgi:hypothetical protein